MVKKRQLLPHIEVTGDAYDCGRQYGTAAKERIHRSLGLYRRVFRHYADLTWPNSCELASVYASTIQRVASAVAEEMHGIADGANVPYESILALNSRSEIMFQAAPQAPLCYDVLGSECSAFTVLPESTRNNHTLVGQNWDWLISASDTAVMLEVHRPYAPDYTTIVEAGMVAKTSMNDAGLAICTNTLVNELAYTGGVPYHIILRMLLDTTTISDAVGLLLNTDKALPANYLLGHRDGLAINVETVAGYGAASADVTMPYKGLLVHTNHFQAPEFATHDIRMTQRPSTLFRRYCLESSITSAVPDVTIDTLQEVLADHRNKPGSVCAHADDNLAELDQMGTIVSVVYDVTRGDFHVCAGNPCTTPYRVYTAFGSSSQCA